MIDAQYPDKNVKQVVVSRKQLDLGDPVSENCVQIDIFKKPITRLPFCFCLFRRFFFTSTFFPRNLLSPNSLNYFTLSLPSHDSQNELRFSFGVRGNDTVRFDTTR